MPPKKDILKKARLAKKLKDDSFVQNILSHEKPFDLEPETDCDKTSYIGIRFCFI